MFLSTEQSVNAWDAQEPYLILSDPKGIRHVLSAFPSNYPRPESDRIILETMVSANRFPLLTLLKVVRKFGRGVLCAEGRLNLS